MRAAPEFRAPNAAERVLNKAFGALVRAGLGRPHNDPAFEIIEGKDAR